MQIFCFVFDIKLCPSTLFLQKQSPARVIPRIIPDTYPESYPNLALLCHGPVSPFRKQPQSPAWCRREPFDIGYSLYVDSKEGGANHTPNHTSETYLETYLRIIPPMQHALLTTEFSYTANLELQVVGLGWRVCVGWNLQKLPLPKASHKSPI